MNIRKLSKITGSPLTGIILQFDIINRLEGETVYIRQTAQSVLWGIHIKTYHRSLKSLQELGLITIKQAMSRYKDFLPKEYLKKLSEYEQDAKAICTLVTITPKLKELIK